MSDQDPTSEQKPSKVEIIRQIAKTLQERRQLRQISIEKVSQSTKIRIQIIQALEKGEWHELPGEVYIRGFVIRYAQFLGLNGQELIQPYLDLEGRASYQSAQEEFDQSDTGIKQRSQQNEKLWIIGSVSILVLIGLIRFLMSGSNPKKEKVVTPVPTVSTQEVVSSTQVARVPLKARKRKLEVYSPYSLWLKVNSDSKTFEGFITEKSTWTWEGEGTLTLRLGHSKEIIVTCDGHVIPVAENQKKVIIPNEN